MGNRSNKTSDFSNFSTYPTMTKPALAIAMSSFLLLALLRSVGAETCARHPRHGDGWTGMSFRQNDMCVCACVINVVIYIYIYAHICIYNICIYNICIYNICIYIYIYNLAILVETTSYKCGKGISKVITSSKK